MEIKRLFIRLVRILLIGGLLLNAEWLMGQVSGNSNPLMGTSEYYSSFIDVYMTSPYWVVSGGSISSESHSGFDHSVTVDWGDPGSGSLTLYDGGTPYGYMGVTIAAPEVSNPSTTFSYTNNCGNSVITRNSSPPSNVTWYWQTSSSGTSTSNPENTYTVNSSGTYYLRGRHDIYTSYWSSGATSTSAVTVKVVPGSVTSPTGGARCGTGTVALSAGAGWSGSGVKWYTASSGGTLLYTGTSYTTSSISSTTTYYACTYVSSTGCESSRTAITATVNSLPSAPATASSSPSDFYGSSGTVTLSATGAGSGETYSWYTVPSNGTAGSSTPNVTSTTIFYASKKVTATTCESATRTPVTVGVFSTASISPSGTLFLAYGGSMALTATSGFATYQWLLNDNAISGATGQTYLAKQTGVYKVQVKGLSTSSTYTSSAVTIIGPTGQAVNMVSSTSIYKEGLSISSLLDTLSRSGLSQRITYMDGLGRPFQSVAVAASPEKYDMIIAGGSGVQGLTDTTYLPFVGTTNDGRFRTYALRGSNNTYAASEQYSFYQNASLVAHDTRPFSRSIHRQTPDARVIEESGPGYYWRPVAHDTSHTVRSSIGFNGTSDSVRLWKPDGTTTAFCAAKTVVVETTKDENGNQVKTFTNAFGQTVLKKVQWGASSWLRTYYIYDEYGRLKYQVPPRAVGLLDGSPNLESDTNLAELIYKYTYDSRGRVITKKVPGAVEEYIVYDKLDRVVLTQDGNLKSLNRWMFIKYDYYGRPAYSGYLSSSSSRATLQAALDAEDYTQSTVKWYEAEASGTNDYTNYAYPRSGATVLTVNYYDHYDFNRNGAADYKYDSVHLSGQESTSVKKPRGSATGSRKLTVDAAGNVTSTWLWSVVFYGKYDRVIQTLSNNHLYSTLADKSTVIYDFAGQALKTKTTHRSSATVSVNLTDRPVYDHAGRVLKLYRQIDSNAEFLICEYMYNALGQMVDKRLSGPDNTYPQSVDYRFNIRGWLTSINNSKLTNDGLLNDDVNDLFGMEIMYNTITAGLNDQSGDKRYSNGNISAIKWKTAVDGLSATDGQRSFKFEYDLSDRLKQSTFQAYKALSTNWTGETGSMTEKMTYDANGNILTLERYKPKIGASLFNVGSEKMDDLSYTYATNTNRLQKVEDAGDTGGFNNGSVNGTDEYVYSSSGSLTADKNKKIDSIHYNFLGKPRRIKFNDGKVVTYTYDASGTKLKMTVSNGATTDYVNSFVYTNNALSFFSSPEGRTVKNGSAYDYEFAIADNQGNTRILVGNAFESSNLINTANPECTSTTGFTVYSNGTVTAITLKGETYVKSLLTQAGGTPGIYPIGGTLTVVPGEKYTFKVRGYTEGSTAYLRLASGSDANIVWTGTALPVGSGEESWVTVDVTIPSGVTSVKLGVQFNSPANGSAIFLNKVGFYKHKDDDYVAGFESANQASEGGVFQNYNTSKIINGTVYARTGTKSYRLTSSSSVGNEVIGAAKSIRVYTGDVVSMEVYGKYLAATSTSTNPGAILATALQSAFQLSSGGATEKAYNAVQSLFGTGAVVGTSGFPYEDSAPPKAYLNYILFDDNYVPYDFGYDQIGTGGLISGGSGTPNKMSLTARARKPGYAYIYLSNENGTIVEVYFDDLAIKHVKSPILQHNEYYAYGMQTANSWTRDAVTANNFLSNGGTELNPTTQLYDLDFRNYDPALGRMYGVDPMAGKYSSLTPYNYSFNNPISFNDPSGADPDPGYVNPNHNYYFYNGNGAMGVYGLTYDDRAPNPGQGYGDYNCAYCWRKDNVMGWFGGGGASLNAGSFGSQAARYSEGVKAQAMAGLIAGAYNGADGSHRMTFTDGWLSSYDFKSTKELLHEAGTTIARGYYGGNGSMPAGYVPPNHRPGIAMPVMKITLATLPVEKVQGPSENGRIWVAGNAIFVRGRNLNPEGMVIGNLALKQNIAKLYVSLVSKLGTSDFQFKVTGGDRYQRSYRFPGVEGRIPLTFSSTNGSFIPTSGPDHISGIAADVRIKFNDNSLVPVDFVRPLLEGAGLMFDDGAMPSRYSDRHYHFVLQD